MRNIENPVKTHFGSDVTTIATLWKITRRDRAVFGYTDAVEDITFEGLLHKAGTGFSASAISHSAKFNVEHIEVDGFTPVSGIDDVDITDKDLLDGKYDFADVEISQINYERPGDGSVKSLKGNFGQFELKHNQFRVELISIGSGIQHNIGEIYSLSCRAKLGDLRCKVPLATVAQAQLFQIAGPLVGGDTISVNVTGRDTTDLTLTAPLVLGHTLFIAIDGVELSQVFATSNDITLDNLAVQIQAEPNVGSALRVGTDTIQVISLDDDTILTITGFQVTGTATPTPAVVAVDGPNWPVSQLFTTDSNTTMDLFAAKIQARTRVASAVVSNVAGTDTERDITVTAAINGTDVPMTSGLISPSSINIIITQTVAGSAGQTFTGTVAFVGSQQRFTARMPDNPTGDFDYGIITWLNGENQGRSMEVKSFTNAGFGFTDENASGATFDLFLPMASPINQDDSFSVNRGCDYKFATCKDKFDNVNNFRGEPHIPTPEQSAQNPRTI